MEIFKSPTARLARLFKKSRDAWKTKALQRQERLRASAVKIRDLEQSRAAWKARALAVEAAVQEGVTQSSPADDVAESAEKTLEAQAVISPPAGHQYTVAVIKLSLQMFLQDSAFGSRGVVRVLARIAAFTGESAPAYTTVLNWVYRFGLAVLSQAPEQRDDWIYVVDHTIALGQAKCLVILGIPAEKLAEVGYSPNHQDMQVLAVEVTAHSTGVWVAGVLERVAERTGTPVQIVADHGSDLNCGIRLFLQKNTSCVATYDISHSVALQIKAELSKDNVWNAFLSGCSACATSLRQTNLAFLMPPRQRTKARFMSLDVHVRWAQYLLAYYDRGDFSAIAGYVFTEEALTHLHTEFGGSLTAPLQPCIDTRYPTQAALCQAIETKSDLTAMDLDETFWNEANSGRQRFLEGFAWLLPFRATLSEYEQIFSQSKQIQTHLKTNGLHQGVQAALKTELAPRSTLSPRAASFTEAVLTTVESEAAKIPADQTLLASSDIIESVFGKYKDLTARGPLKEIGKLVLAIPAFLTALTLPLIREAMETVRTLDVEQWAKTHIGPSMLAQRRQALINPMKDTKIA